MTKQLMTKLVIPTKIFSFFSKEKSDNNAKNVPAKISFNIILLNLAIRIIAIFLLIDLFVFSS